MKIEVGKAILHLNDEQSMRNRRRLEELRLVAVNVLASPGAGKTSLIIRLLEELSRDLAVGVIEGDVASSIDTQKLRGLGYAATQINTDGGCHLDARMVASAIEALAIKGPGFLFIENIGNLICPTNYHLGESLRIVVASVPEGDDKPAKYPGVFASADAVVLNKVDLLGQVDFEMDRFRSMLHAASPKARLFEVSCRKPQGLTELADWLKQSATPTDLKS